ncbi:hypothetical protein BDY17DRAFT_308922 [Neohortaea acidophila]|uniref:Fungal-specific transcription factor domain-containing protein n=1 Tax=Neohortaea acidophila TaxID=245834 RepID=A0A6A6PZW6_9PEZI|nr:uncharacterized protein BDY17DRAFT_308922 [Neohortaea acidophila]KAF2485562.1 hypothetical protein BDY17DRAFT_308922 [Neohortaea acidophila]
MSRPGVDNVVWINKTPQSASLSHSEGLERINLLSQAQRNSRALTQSIHKTKRARKARKTNTVVVRFIEADKITRGKDKIAPDPVSDFYPHLQLSIPRALMDSLFDIQRSEFIHSLHKLHLEDSVYAFIPSRIGTSRVVEDAAHAVVAAQNYRLTPIRDRNERLHLAAAASYISAIRVLKGSVDGSDACLMACLLLQLSHSLSDHSDDRRENSSAHIDGIAAVLADKARQFLSRPPSDFARMAFYSLRYCTYFLPIAQGVASPFDDGLTARLKWTSPTRSPTSQEVCLRQIAHELFVRLPRLIAGTRSLRNGDGADRDSVLNLAADLCELHDPDTETWFLRHKTTYVHTVEVYREHVGDYSLSFPSLSEWECMVVYWETHLVLFRLCYELSRLAPMGHPTVRKFKNHAYQDGMAQAILMSWTFVHQRCNTGLGTRIKTALIACYSVMRLKATWHGSVATLRQWINQVLHKDGALNPDAADIGDALAGGAIQPFRDWASGSRSILGNRGSNK